jgi:hypothetical protein
VLTSALELLCASLVALFLYAIFPPAALLPFAAVAGLMAWTRR